MEELREQIAKHLALVDGVEWEYLPTTTATKEGYREIADEILPLIKEYYVPKEEIEKLEPLSKKQRRQVLDDWLNGKFGNMPAYEIAIQAQLNDSKKTLLGRMK